MVKLHSPNGQGFNPEVLEAGGYPGADYGPPSESLIFDPVLTVTLKDSRSGEPIPAVCALNMGYFAAGRDENHLRGRQSFYAVFNAARALDQDRYCVTGDKYEYKTRTTQVGLRVDTLPELISMAIDEDPQLSHKSFGEATRQYFLEFSQALFSPPQER